jgi:hypothetical protein
MTDRGHIARKYPRPGALWRAIALWRRGFSPASAHVIVVLFLASGPVRAQMATAERVQQPGWWPTSPLTSRDEYVGAAQCASCHRTNVTSQQTTSMAQTATRAKDSRVLREHQRLMFQAGGFTYTMERIGDGTTFGVTDGTRSLTAPLTWSFGRGNVGQSYLFERDGTFHESRVSYYDAIQRLDVTPNRTLTGPATIEEAMSRPIDKAEARRCFGCHTTGSTTRAGFDATQAIPGVTCEACHGPGRRHVNAMEKGANRARAAETIMNPQRLDPADSVDFCGACHATFWDVQLAGERGIAALRSQPFRLQSSRCWTSGDRRITCVGCHDPHKPLVRDRDFYDARCQSCHRPEGASETRANQLRTCPVSKANCVTCHMPKYKVPEMHYAFTDHLIRTPASTAAR